MDFATAPVLRTPRLVLRGWRAGDLAPFARLCADPAVMEHFPSRLDRGESERMVERIQPVFDRHGFGLWAVEVPGRADFVGYVGLLPADFVAPGAIEVGWRLAAEAWGQGYATEGALAALRFGFEQRGLDEIVSFTVPANRRSRRVMEKLGMRHEPERDFDHPRVDAARHPHLVRHVLYALRADAWRTSRRRGGAG